MLIEVSHLIEAEGIELVNGRDALLSDNVDEEFINNICMLIENPRLRKQIGDNGRKVCEEKYNWEKNAERIIKIYSEFVKY